MNTNYGSWETYDVDKALGKLDEQHIVDDFLGERMRTANNGLKDVAAIHTTTKIETEALISKAAVEALKSKGFVRRRDRASVVNNLQSTKELAEINIEIHIPTVESNLAIALESLCESLAQQLREVQLLRSYSIKEVSHGLGYTVGLKLMETIHVFGKLKSQIVTDIGIQQSNVDKSHSSILEGVSRSEQFLLTHVTESLALCALNKGEFSVSCDVSRCRIRLQQKQQQYESMRQRRQECDTDKAVGSARHLAAGPGSGSGPEDELLWLIRAAAFAGMGQVHLALTHCKEAERINPTYPDIALTVSYLESVELLHARAQMNLSTCAMQERDVCADVRRLFHTLSVTSASKSGVLFGSLGIVHRTHFESLLQGLPCLRDSSDGDSGSCDLDELQDHYDCLPLDQNDDDNSSVGTSMTVNILLSMAQELGAQQRHCDGAPVLQELSAQQRHCDCAPVLQELARRALYEGQLLFMESMFLSAEVKYISTILFVQAQLCHLSSSAHTRASEDNVTAEGHYCRRLIAVCLLNMGMCRLHRNSLIGQAGGSFLADLTSRNFTAAVLTRCSALELVSWAQSLRDTAAARLLRSDVLAVLHRFDEGILELDNLRAMIVPSSEPSQEVCNVHFITESCQLGLHRALSLSSSPTTADKSSGSCDSIFAQVFMCGDRVVQHMAFFDQSVTSFPRSCSSSSSICACDANTPDSHPLLELDELRSAWLRKVDERSRQHRFKKTKYLTAVSQDIR